MQKVIEVVEVTLLRGGKRIVDNVSWSTHVGEHWVVLGPNGAGKTSLLRATVGRELPNSGRVEVCGMDTATTDLADITAVAGFSSNSLNQRLRPSLSVRDVVRTAAWGVHESWDESYEDVDNARVDDLLAAFGVAHLADARFGSLSEGERQRTLLARSLMTDPEVLILDEPGAGLDLGAREILVTALSQILESPTAPQLIMVTHQVEEIPAGITHAAVIKDGRIIAAGPITEVLNGVTLSEAYELPLTAGSTDGRWWARALPIER